MSDPFTAIWMALQATFAPVPPAVVPDVPPAPAQITSSVTQKLSNHPSWYASVYWDEAAQAPIPAVRPDIIKTPVVVDKLPKLACTLEQKGNKFVAVVVADASYSIDYSLVLKSKGSNSLNIKKSDEFDVKAGRNRIDLDTNIKVAGQKISGDLTLIQDGRKVHCE